MSNRGLSPIEALVVCLTCFVVIFIITLKPVSPRVHILAIDLEHHMVNTDIGLMTLDETNPFLAIDLKVGSDYKCKIDRSGFPHNRLLEARLIEVE